MFMTISASNPLHLALYLQSTYTRIYIYIYTYIHVYLIVYNQQSIIDNL